MIRRVLVGQRDIVYELTRKKVKNINLRIHLDGRITVSASPRVPEAVIEQFIVKKSAFILHALERFGERQSVKDAYGEGDKISFFGDELTLRRACDKKRRVERREEELWLFLRDTDGPMETRKTVEDFMRSELTAKLNEIVPTMSGRFDSEPAVELSAVKIRKMKSRWGSCNCKSGEVTFNLHLAEHPISCLEFVVMHELCHLFHPNHSRNFYALLSSVMPDWKERREVLNGKR